MKRYHFIMLAALILHSHICMAQAPGSILERTNAFTKVDPPTLYRDRELLGTIQTTQFQITQYENFPQGDARTAVEEATKIWGYILNCSHPQPIKVWVRGAIFSDDRVIARTTAEPALNVMDSIWYPRALAKAMGWANTAEVDSDIVLTVNSHYLYGDSFYYGIDGNTPQFKVDFLTIVLHELAHGLGFETSFKVDSNQMGRKGRAFGYSDKYDRYCIYGNHYELHRPDSLLWRLPDSNALLGQRLKSDNIYFGGYNSYLMGNQSNVPKLFAPSVFREGSSISHLDSLTYRFGNSNSLMVPGRAWAEAVHSPGEFGLSILQDLGWTVNRLITFTSPASNQSVVRGDSIQLVWTDNQTGTVFADLMKREVSGTYSLAAFLGAVASTRGSNPAKKLLIPATVDSGMYKIRFITETSGQGYGATFDFLVTSSSQVERVVLYPPGNTYHGPTNVSMSCSTQGATIRFTTDGTVPTESSPVCPTGGLDVLSSATITAKAFKPPLTPSEPQTEEYTIDPTAGVVIGPRETSQMKDVVRYYSNGQGPYYANSGPHHQPYVGTGTFFIGGVQSQIARTFLQWWNLPVEIIPDSITSASIEIQAYNWSVAPSVSLYRTIGSMQDDSNLWNSPNPGGLVENNISFGSTGRFAKTYYRGSAFVNQLKAGLNLDRSLQIGIVSQSESQSNRWMQAYYANLTIRYTKPIVRIAQTDSAGVSFGQWARWETDQWKYYPDTTLIRPTSATAFTLRADTNYKPATTQKYNLWRKNDVIDSLRNHSDLPVDANTSSWKAVFKPSKPATVRAFLIDAEMTGGTINFKDPWLVDTTDEKGLKNRGNAARWWNRSSPFSIDTNSAYKGVFLNENPFFDPTKPNYSVGAPNPNTFTIGGNNYQAYFRNWEGSSVQYQNAEVAQTGVVFTNSDATATAKYKLHLASNSPEAMAFNTQRKITRDSLGYWHKVYQSADLIWYTRSLNTSDTSWAPEVLLSSSLLPPDWLHRDPSVIFVPSAISPGQEQGSEATEATFQPARVRVVWETYTSDASNHEITVCEINPVTGGILYGPATLHNWEGQGQRARPVLGVAREGDPKYPPTSFFTLVTWFQSGMDELRCSMWLPDNSASGITDLGNGITEFSLSPYSNTDIKWHLAYIENNNVMYVPITAAYWPQPGTPQTVCEGDESVYLNAPSISSVNANAFGDPIGITWQAYYWEFVTGVIQYSERNTQTWSYPATWVPYYTTASYVKPSVTGSIGTPKATIAWQTTETPLMYTVRGRPGAWGSVAAMGGGVDPTLSAGYLANSFEYLVSRGTSAPYAIQRQGISTTDENEEGDSMPFTSEGRGGRLMFRNGSLHIAVLDAQTNDMRLGFAEMNDTTRINLSQFENVFVTEPFAGTGTLKLRTLFTAKGQLPNGINIRMTLRDAATGNVVQNLRTFHVGDDTLVTFQTPLNHGNRQLKLVLQPVGVSQLSRIDLERWYVLDDAASLAKPLANATASSGLPEVFALHPNYPNPFNPTTTIKYDLPEPSHVSLVVYDLLGRKVTELVSGPKSEGYHSATWDASGVASGVYFARFTATDISGGVRLNKVSKLVLTK